MIEYRTKATERIRQLLRVRIRPWDLVLVSAVIVSISTILGFFGRFWWFLDLFSHFRVQYFFGLLGVALALGFRRRSRLSWFFGCLAIANLFTIAPLYFGLEPEPLNSSRKYRSLLVNVNTKEGDPDRVARLITQLDPDILVLEEINQQWSRALRNTLRRYPHTEVKPQEDNFGIGLYSKYPFAECRVLYLGEAEVPTITAEVVLPDGRLRVIATHALPPTGAENSHLRNDQLRRLPALVTEATSPVLLLGDLNVTPWSHHFQQLLRDSGLRDSAQGRGFVGTWPAHLPVLLIPIDHALYSPGVFVTRRARGAAIGSDHYPLILDFVVALPAGTVSGSGRFQLPPARAVETPY